MVSKVVVVPLVVVSEYFLQNELLHQGKLVLMVVVIYSIVLLEVLMKKLLELVVSMVAVLVEAMVLEELRTNKMAWRVQALEVLHENLEKIVD